MYFNDDFFQYHFKTEIDISKYNETSKRHKKLSIVVKKLKKSVHYWWNSVFEK